MWKLIPLLMFFIAPSVKADLVHRLSTSTQLSVTGAATSAERIGSTYAVSGSNIKVGTGNSDVFGGLTIGSATAAATMKAGTYDVNTVGSAFSFSESYTQGDGIAAMGAGVDVTSGVVADMPALHRFWVQMLLHGIHSPQSQVSIWPNPVKYFTLKNLWVMQKFLHPWYL